MHAMKFFGVTAILLAVVSICAAQDTAAPASAQKAAPTVKHVPITQTASNSGKEMFNNYCAVCHGRHGKGDGPAAAALKVPPTDLTTLAQKMEASSLPTTSQRFFTVKPRRRLTAARTCCLGSTFLQH